MSTNQFPRAQALLEQLPKDNIIAWLITSPIGKKAMSELEVKLTSNNGGQNA